MAPVLVVLLLSLCGAQAAMDSCYEPATGRAQRCMPEFCNAAFGRTVLASHVCGSPGPEEFCLQTGVTGVTKSCHLCDAHDSHNASLLNDFHSEEEPTWWQSPSMLHGIQFPNSVNLTLHLGKSFEITYIRLKFHTSRPESFAIYKRTHEGAPWTPYQYYSASCQQTYSHSTGTFLRAGDEERVPFCTDEFSDISPLTGGNVAFSTLEGRPSAYSFDSSPVLQDWVTATDLLISLNRLNTFGDDIFRDHRVLRSYYYAISDLSVGGRCKCNGHASECVTNGQGRLVCDCQHSTSGIDCERCQPFYHDRPWARASAEAANECLPCNCSGKSEQCIFNMDLYRRTGHGGQCLNCRDNTAGSHCETCKENFHRRTAGEMCQPCNCSVVGSLSLQCDHNGDCVCKATVTGKKCDQCQKGYHSLSEGGCRKCGCHPEGSIGDCDPTNGECTCKRNVEGALCHRCKSGTFNLQPHNSDGCRHCFCYSHSAACTSASHFAVHHIVSSFQQDPDGWQRQNLDGEESSVSWEKGRISLIPEDGEWEYFIAPAKFLGNQLLSYGQNLSLLLHVESEDLPSFMIILEGSGIHVSASVSPPVPNETLPWEWAVNFTLHEVQAGIQSETVSSFQFQQLLSNLTALKLGTNRSVSIHLMDVTLVTAQAGLSPRAAWVEECVCPEGYIGQFCEACAPGYKREIPFGGPLSPCVACTCNQHGSCEPESGICQCVHNTVGPSCEYCASGYYGNPFRGRYNDCKPCPCPAQSNCTVLEDRNEVVCTDCPDGQTGMRCETCDDGFYGDPLGLWQGFVRPCSRCQCNGNTDPNAVGNCDPVTGQCLKCLFHTVGHYCDMCEDGFYGNALAPSPAGKCQPCACDPIGSTNGLQNCDPGRGQCECLPHVIGRDCSQCEPGYYDLRPTMGCLSCACHPLGSRNSFCQGQTGQCNCRPGVEGRACDRCQRGYFDFSQWGCQACDCSPLGSLGMQCLGDGSCLCKTGFVGRKCEQCQENYYYEASTFHCQLCPTCYNLVQLEVEQLKHRMWELGEVLTRFSHNPEQLYQLYTDHLQSSLQDMEAQAVQGSGAHSVDLVGEVEMTLARIGQELSNISHSLDCEGSELKRCIVVAASKRIVQSTLTQLQATRDTLNTKMPWLIHRSPSEEGRNWTGLVKESRSLAESQVKTAMEVESIVRDALVTSNQSYILLTGIIQDDSIAADIMEAEHSLQSLQSQMEGLTEEADKVLKEAKRLYMSTQPTRGANLTLPPNLTQPQPEGWNNFTAEIANLESALQIKDQQIEKLLLEVGTRVKAFQMGMETKEMYDELLSRVKSSRATARASIQKVKQINEEGISLLKILEDNKRPAGKLRGKGSLRKMGVIKGKVMPETKRKTALARRILRVAGSSSTISNATASRAWHVNHGITKEAHKLRRQAQDQAVQSGSLRTRLDITQGQLATQEEQAASFKVKLQEDGTTAAKVLHETLAMGKEVKKAKQSLDRDLKQLTELLKTVESLQVDQVTEEMLNITEAEMGALRWVIDQTLDQKLRELEAASDLQILKMKTIEKDMEDIEAEKLSLEDIVENLPQGCYNRVGF